MLCSGIVNGSIELELYYEMATILQLSLGRASTRSALTDAKTWSTPFFLEWLSLTPAQFCQPKHSESKSEGLSTV